MTFSISTYGLQLLTSGNLSNQQNTLATLNQQLASGQQHSNLTDYTPVEAHNLMDFQNGITQKKSYLAGMQTVNTRLNVYDSTMTDMENITSQMQALAGQNQNYDATKIAQIQAQVQSALKQMQDDLNQQVSGRYLYAGSRYSTQPVGDLTAMSAPTLPFSLSTSPALPPYDSTYNPPTTTTDANAYTKDSVTVDNAFSLQYGVTSADPGFQRVIAGLQLINDATKQADPTVYNTNLVAASNLLSSGISNIQSTHAGVAGNLNIIKQQTDVQNSDINNLTNQISDIQNVDLTSVGTQINLMQTQLQASYSSTASLIQESILKYL